MSAAAKQLDPNVPMPPPGGKAIQRIKPDRVGTPGQCWNTHEATVPVDTPLEHLLAGEFWRFVAPKFRRGDHIRWRNDSLTRFGEIVIVALDIATSKMELREIWTRDVEPAAMAETERGGFTVRDLGVHDGFGIFRDADGKLLADKIASYDEAQRRIKVEFRPNMAAMAIHDAKAGR